MPILIAILIAFLTVQVHAVPTSYIARTDRNIAAEPTLPTMGAAGSIITDPTFSNRIMRVTDANSVSGFTNEDWLTAGGGSAEALDFNANNTRFLVEGSPNGITVAFNFFPSTFSASLIQTDLSGVFPIVTCVWDPVNPDIAYGSDSGHINSYNVVTRAVATVWDMTAIGDGSALRSTSMGNNGRIAGFVGNQNVAPIAAVKDLNTSQTWILDTSLGKLNGSTIVGFSTFTIHNIRFGQDGRYAVLTPGAGGAGDMMVWDIDGSTYNWCANAACTGHKVNAYGYLLNQDGSGAVYFGYELQKRSVSDMATHVDLITRDASPVTGDDSHYSWGNAQSNKLVPVISGATGEGKGTSATDYPWDREIIAIATDGSGTVWRLAHVRSIFTRFEDGPHPIVSRDGMYVMFGSNWGQTLGTNPDSLPRVDVFMLELRAPASSYVSTIAGTSVGRTVAGTGKISVTP